MSEPHVLVLQHIAPETPGRLAAVLAQAGVALRTVKVFEGEPVPARLDEARGLVVMGGPMGVYEEDRYPHLGDEKRLIQDAVGRDRPVIGICLGSQLVASALGAGVRYSGRQEIGWHEVTFSEAAATDPLFAGAPRSFVPLHWHGDVFDRPEGAVALARSAFTELQAFRYGTKVYGLLFHLEADEAVVRGMVGAFAEQARGHGIDPDAIVKAMPERLPSLDAVARPVFERWVALVR